MLQECVSKPVYGSAKDSKDPLLSKSLTSGTANPVSDGGGGGGGEQKDLTLEFEQATVLLAVLNCLGCEWEFGVVFHNVTGFWNCMHKLKFDYYPMTHM